jgi:glycosyltransferase involved in cell wall biosynthesis
MNMPTNLSEHSTESKSIIAAPTLEELLRYQDRAFVECAYLTLLRRAVDPTGLDHYLDRLRNGTPKIQILDEMSRSPEALSTGVVLPGLRSATRKYNLAKLPLIGRILDLFYQTESNGPVETRLRTVEQQIFALQSLVQQCHQLAAQTAKTLTIESSRGAPQYVKSRASDELRALARETVHRPINGRRTLYFYIDHTVQCQTNTGMQRVARNLAKSLLAAGEQVMFVKWDSDKKDLVLVSRVELEHFSKWNGPRLSEPQAALYSLANEDALTLGSHARTEGCWLIVPEVPYITFHPAPVTLELLTTSRRKGLWTLFVYHDLIPLRRPEFADLAAQHETYTTQMLLADLLIPVSRWVATDVVSFFREHDRASLSPTPKVTPLLNPGTSPSAPRVTQPKVARDCDHLILSVGTLEARKNQTTLLHAFESFCVDHPGSDWELVLVGNLHPTIAPEIVRATAQNKRISFLKHVSDEDLDTLYQRCAFTVFPSVEEGFGLPILESLWYAKPCICANFGAMLEVAAGGGCLTVDTRSETAVLGAMTSLIESPDLRQRMSREAAARSLIDWSDYARSLIGAMEPIASPIRGLGPVYYWVDHTCTYPVNSGIQRVVRGLARALIDLGVELIPIKWDFLSRKMVELSATELQHISKWNGPPAVKWSNWREPHGSTGWLLVPELTTYVPQAELSGFREYLLSMGLRAAWIFYDAIPWKMRDIYPAAAAKAHGTYMSGLNRQELVLAISNFSYADLVEYLAQQPDRTPSLFERVFPCPLPGEFTDSPRVLNVRESTASIVTILSVGTVEPRKNHRVLLEAFRQLKLLTDARVELVIAGGAPFPELTATIEAILAAEPDARWVTSPSDAELVKLYGACDFTVYASPEEGFGLPIVESLWHARPCVCASFGAMGEIAADGGCVVTDVRDASQLARAMLKLVEDKDLRRELGIQATNRLFKTWHEYAMEVASRMASERIVPLKQSLPATFGHKKLYKELVNLRRRPKLSVCVSTYNRAAWLDICLRNLVRLWPIPHPDVEIVVCDNASSDRTTEVVAPYLARDDLRYIRNPENVGMLGNLRVTAHQARGEYIWILGDDDLICAGGIQQVLNAIRSNAEVGLVYLNYSYTHLADASAVSDLDKFLAESTPIVAPGPDRTGSVREICTLSENFFTAIYCLVFRRDHALRAYTQNTDGRPFSTLLRCIPTTYYVLNYMIDESACWLGTPVVVVNMNVSWMKYAPLWILERVPEVYDLAERLGADRVEVDRWRRNNLPGVVHYLRDIFEKDSARNVEYFSMRRLLSRLKGLPGIEDFIEPIRSIYLAAHESGHPAARASVDELFSGFGGDLQL